MATYYGVIHKEEGTDYGLSFPDLPGCITSGNTLEELSVMASEALKRHLEGMGENKKRADPICGLPHFLRIILAQVLL